MPTPEQIREYQEKLYQREVNQQIQEHVQNKIYTSSELIERNLPEVYWTVNQMILQGLTIIAGQSKVGKSWFLLQMGICIASGGRFLGKYRCQQQDTLYIALEDNQRRMRDRLLRIGHTSKRLFIDTTNVINPQTLPAVLDAMPTVQTVIIDTLGRYLEGEGVDSNSYHEQTKAVGALHSLAKERGISIIACTHTRKNSGQKDSDFADDVIGSKATIAVADTVLKLSRARFQEDGKLEITGRDVNERVLELSHAENWLWFDVTAEPEPPIDNPNRDIEPAYSEWNADGNQGELEF